MSRKGLISLRRDDTDRRRQIITITATGQQIIDNNIENAEQIVQGFKNTLGVENYEQLLDLLAKLSLGREQVFEEDQETTNKADAKVRIFGPDIIQSPPLVLSEANANTNLAALDAGISAV